MKKKKKLQGQMLFIHKRAHFDKTNNRTRSEMQKENIPMGAMFGEGGGVGR